MSNKVYNKKSIESLSPLEFTRLKPGVYCGDTTYSTQLLVEILSNAVDEYNLGHGDTINIICDNKNKIYTVKDSGQGFIPNSFRDDGKSILEAAFSVLNTSGKYREDGTYEGVSLGNFGIGSKITTYLSHWLTVSTYRNSKYETVKFKEGVFENREVGECDNNIHGTTVSWNPSEEFFTNSNIDMSAIKSLFETIVCLCKGLTIVLTEDNKDPITYKSTNGLDDYVDHHIDNEILNDRLNINYQNGKNKMNLIMTYADNYSSTIIPYVNTGLTDSGPHITAFKTAVTREMNKFFKEKKWLKDSDANLSGDDIQEGIYLIFNLTTSGVSYDAQVKSRIVNIDTKEFIKVFADELYLWMTKNEKELKKIVDKALTSRKAREAAKKARDTVRKKTEKKKKALKFDSKLADCYSKDRLKCEIMVVEGDSAAGNLKQARNNEFQAVMPVRGKILNTQKATLDKIMKNAEIMTMIEAFGLTADSKTMKLSFNEDSLRYGKIIILSDADVSNTAYERLFA